MKNLVAKHMHINKGGFHRVKRIEKKFMEDEEVHEFLEQVRLCGKQSKKKIKKNKG